MSRWLHSAPSTPTVLNRKLCAKNIPPRRVWNCYTMKCVSDMRIIFNFLCFSFLLFLLRLVFCAFEAGCRATYSYLLGFLYWSLCSDSTNVAQNTLDSTAANQIVWKRECDRKVQAIEYMQYERQAAAFINTFDHQAITNLRHLAPFSFHSANARTNHRWRYGTFVRKMKGSDPHLLARGGWGFIQRPRDARFPGINVSYVFSSFYFDFWLQKNFERLVLGCIEANVCK